MTIVRWCEVLIGWRRLESTWVECPETGKAELVQVDVVADPDRITDIVACSRFRGESVSCRKRCMEQLPGRRT